MSLRGALRQACPERSRRAQDKLRDEAISFGQIRRLLRSLRSLVMTHCAAFTDGSGIYPATPYPLRSLPKEKPPFSVQSVPQSVDSLPHPTPSSPFSPLPSPFSIFVPPCCLKIKAYRRGNVASIKNITQRNSGISPNRATCTLPTTKGNERKQGTVSRLLWAV